MSASFESAHGEFAPVDPTQPPDRLEQERQLERIRAPRLSLFLNRTLDAIAELDKSDNLKITNEMTRCVAYYDGRWDGYVRNGTWYDNPKIDGEIQPKDNDFKKQIDKLNMEMCRAKIQYNAEPIEKFDPAKREAAEFVNRRIAVNQDRIETEPFLQSENYSLLLKTWTLRYSYFSKSAPSSEKDVQIEAMRAMVEGQSIDVCRTCQMKAEQVPCPHCGDTETRTVASPPSESVQYHQKKVAAGRAVTVRPDATMVQMDLNARDVPSSSFLRWRLVLRRCDWEEFFPNTVIPSSEETIEARRRSEAQAQPSNSEWSTSSTDIADGGNQFEKIEGELVWLDPKVYARYASKEAEQLGDHTLEPGAKFSSLFTDGVCVARIGKKILDLFPSNKNVCWTMCVYGMREWALHGSGTIALLGPQDTINDENAFIVGNHYQSAAGREFARSGAIEGGKMPTINQLGIINGAPDEVQDITRWAIGRTQPQSLTGDVYAFRESMRGSLQDAAGTSSLSNQGAADMKALGTATGVEASRDQAIGRIIPNRKLQAYMGVEWIKQILQLEFENYTAETFLSSADKPNERGAVEFTERGVKTFFECGPDEFIIKPVEGSWVPTSPQQVKANATEFANVAAMTKGQDGSTDKEMLSILAPAYGQDYDVNEWGADQRTASIRLEEYARVCKVLADAQYPPTPELIEVVLANCAEWARVDPEMDRHAAYRNWYLDWYVSDESRRASSLLRMVVKRVYQLHGEGTVIEQQIANKSAKAAAGADEDEQKQQQAQMEAEAAAKQDEVERAIGQEALAERAKEHETEQKLILMEHETDEEIRLQSHQGTVDIKVEKAKPKLPKPKPASKSK